MQRWNTVTIIGVGLIGASVGLALRQRGLAKRLIGVGRRASSLRKAKQCAAVDVTTTNLGRGVAEADLVVVCTPVESIVEHVLATAASCPRGCLVTDAGSTKAKIVATVEAQWPADAQGTFVGSHPMAGSEKAGPENATANLFVRRTVVITPTAATPMAGVGTVEKFWRSLGARVVRMSPSDHDRAVAAISHLPHLIASALSAATPDEDLRLVANGWLDTTRIAAGDAELWRQILQDNQVATLKSLDKFAKVLTDFRRALERGDSRKLVELLEAGKKRRDAVGN